MLDYVNEQKQRKSGQQVEKGSRIVFQHYCEECFAEDKPSEIFTPMIDLDRETWCSSCFTLGGKKRRR